MQLVLTHLHNSGSLSLKQYFSCSDQKVYTRNIDTYTAKSNAYRRGSILHIYNYELETAKIG